MDLSVDSGTYIRLSAVMFLEYAVWGAWAPVLAARLLGPMKMTGKQTGWIYATLPIACIVSPLVSGLLADKYMNTEWVLAVAHAIGAVLLFLAVRQQTFKGMFLVMLLYSLCYGATLPLVNAVLFAHVGDLATQGLVFIWAPIAWALVGYFLTGWRNVRGGEGDGSDCLMLAAVLKAMGGPRPIREARLATLLAMQPRLLLASLSGEEAAQWRRLVGPEAAPLAEGVGVLQPVADHAWGQALRNLRGRGYLVEDLAAQTWAPGPGLKKYPTEGQWPEGRAGMVLRVLRQRGPELVLADLSPADREWLNVQAA